MPSRSSASSPPRRSARTARSGSHPTSSAAGASPCRDSLRKGRGCSARTGNSGCRTMWSLFEAGEGNAEADIEGLDYADGYLWFTGSHASKRKKPKGKDRKKDLERLAVVETEPNRYLLGRVPLVEGVPVKSGPHPTRDGETLEAGASRRRRRRQRSRRGAPPRSGISGRSCAPYMAKTAVSMRSRRWRARRTASTSRAWRSSVAGCSWDCAGRCCAAGRCCWKSSRNIAAGEPSGSPRSRPASGIASTSSISMASVFANSVATATTC